MTLNIGVFLNAVIQFLIVSFAIFWLIKVLTRLNVRQEAAPAVPPEDGGAARRNSRHPGGEAKLATGYVQRRLNAP